MTVEELEQHRLNTLFCLKSCNQFDTLKVVDRLFIDAIGKAALREEKGVDNSAKENIQ